MPSSDAKTPREFAVAVVSELRDAGFEALWAGGCVRDQLLGRTPKDYDVATSARPDEIRQVFGNRRTLAIGEAFGVITVLGSKSAGQIEVATFRKDAAYSDGRHPDSVTFSTAEVDARRRDFTINGLFLDPLTEAVIDYVGGQADLERKVIRAIGDPYERIAEDKLRMLRAVRFAATFEFAIEQETLTAVREQAPEIAAVSAERIAAELRRMLVHKNRHTAIDLLRESNLLSQILPESDLCFFGGDCHAVDSPWGRTLRILRRMNDATFEVALAGLLREIYTSSSNNDPSTNGAAIRAICRRWKLSNDETSGTVWFVENENMFRHAREVDWPILQRLLIAPRVGEMLTYVEAVADVIDGDPRHIDFCREKLALPQHELNPAPLIDGEDLKSLGIPPGPAYARILTETRDAQLVGELIDTSSALEFARALWQRISVDG